MLNSDTMRTKPSCAADLPISIYSYPPARFESQAVFVGTVYSSSQGVTPHKGPGAAQWRQEPSARVRQTGLQSGPTPSSWFGIPDAIQDVFPPTHPIQDQVCNGKFSGKRGAEDSQVSPHRCLHTADTVLAFGGDEQKLSAVAWVQS